MYKVTVLNPDGSVLTFAHFRTKSLVKQKAAGCRRLYKKPFTVTLELVTQGARDEQAKDRL